MSRFSGPQSARAVASSRQLLGVSQGRKVASSESSSGLWRLSPPARLSVDRAPLGAPRAPRSLARVRAASTEAECQFPQVAPGRETRWLSRRASSRASCACAPHEFLGGV